MRRLAAEPTNCPLCLYSPGSLPDLLLHLASNHPSAPTLRHCLFPHCGFCYLQACDHHCHLIQCHLLSGKTLEWKEMMTKDCDLFGKLLALTCRYLLKLKKLGSSSELWDITTEKNILLSALITHSSAVLKLFPRKKRIRRRKRSNSTHFSSSQASPTLQSTSISPNASESP